MNKEILANKKILDAASGGRMFWFNKKNPDVLFIDKRVLPPTETGHGKNKRIRSVLPDIVMDFRNMDLPSNHFELVVFDPPHLFLGKTAQYALQYGRLEKETWKEDIKLGFAECFRVLKPNRVLVFKWNESDVPVREVLKLAAVPPLFGHRSGKLSKTHWIVFMKPDEVSA